MTASLRFALLLILTLIPFQLSHSGELIINEPLERRSLAEHLSYISDNEKILFINELADKQFEGNWLPYTTDKRPEYLLPGVYWFQTRMENRLDRDVTLLIELEYPSIDTADMYLIDDQQKIDVLYVNTGESQPYMERPTFHRNIIKQITIPANEQVTLLWRLESEPMFEFKLTAWNPGTFAARDQHEQLFDGILYGILLVMSLYNFFLFLSTKEKSYLYFVLYSLSTTYLLAAQEGHLYQYIGANTAWNKASFYAVVYAFNAVFFALFSLSFLKLRKHYRGLTRLIRASAIITVIGTLMVSATNQFSMLILSLGALTVLYLSVLIAGIRVRLQGVISAGHFVLAIMVLVLALVTTNMMSIGLIPRTDTTESLLALGTTVMLLFFSLALADRINQLQKESSDALQGLEQANDEKIKASHELIKAQQTRIRLENEAHQAQMESHAKSDFLATISHEIRTPMNGIMGMTEVLNSTKLSGKQSHYVSAIQQSGQVLLGIINDLLDYSKIEAGKTNLMVKPFNLEALLDDCISTFVPRAHEKNLSFTVDLPPEIDQTLKGDTTKLRQVILNLLSNAFKFTKQGGVTLRVSTTHKEAINGVELKFEIQDTGIGLGKEEQRRLFKPFHQSEISNHGAFGSSGLGLAICKQLTELMDGKIGVTSIAGEGATFWFTARLLVEKNPPEELLRTKSSSLRDKRLLLIEKDPSAAEIRKRLLSHWGMQVKVVDSHHDAIAAIAESITNGFRYDIIMADQSVEKDNDGLEIAKALHDESKHKVWSFILMVDNDQPPAQEQLAQYNIDGILEKPVTFALLHDVLCRAIMPIVDLDETPSQPEAVSRWGNRNILLVEDNEINQIVMMGLLEKLDMQVTLASNGTEALDQFRNQRFDLIFMDCDMPEVDGFEAAINIREMEKTLDYETPIIALSSHIKEGHDVKIREAGINTYITKPISYNNIVLALQQLEPQA